MRRLRDCVILLRAVEADATFAREPFEDGADDERPNDGGVGQNFSVQAAAFRWNELAPRNPF